MSDVKAMLDKMSISQAGHLPVVAQFCRRIGLADVVNAAVPTQMAVDVGTAVQLMVLDTLFWEESSVPVGAVRPVSGHAVASG